MVLINIREYLKTNTSGIIYKLPDKKKCFVIAPIGDEKSVIRRRSDQILNYVIKPAVESFNYEVIRSDTIARPGVITNQIIQYLMNSELVMSYTSLLFVTRLENMLFR